MTTGFIVGKFYPFHRGHKYLIDSARKMCDRVTVVVAARDEDTIPGLVRRDWIRETFEHDPSVVVSLMRNTLPDDSHHAWADWTVDFLGYVPDYVFTSEDYGDGWAQAMGSKHVVVDKAREAIPVSGTMIRANPLEYLDYLEPCVREYFVKRVVVVGAESTGKTTLCAELAKALDTKWVPEYGRPYSEWFHEPNDLWESREFTHIAKVQNELEDTIARRANKVLVCDTNSMVTAFWHDRYMGEPNAKVESLAAYHKKPDLYILTGLDVPFHQDEYGLRDRPEGRELMQAEYIKWLVQQDVPYVTVTGPLHHRLELSILAIDSKLFGSGAIRPSKKKPYIPNEGLIT